MMPRELGGVVAADKKVYGVTGLRVGDISTFPTTVSGGPTGTVYAAAEKVSEFSQCVKHEIHLLTEF